MPPIEMDPDNLNIVVEKVCFIIARARQVDVKDVLTDEGDSSNATDDDALEALEDVPDDLSRQELADAIRALNEDERLDLIALARLGMEDGPVIWGEMRAEAEVVEADEGAVRYLLGLPLLADYLEEGLDRFGLSCDGVDNAV